MSTQKKWDYVTAADPCEDCKELWAAGPYTDEQVLRLFPDASPIVPGIIMHPHIHNNCRCALVNREGVEAVEEQGWNSWLAALCIALALAKKKPKKDAGRDTGRHFATTAELPHPMTGSVMRMGDTKGFFIKGSDGKIWPGPGHQGRQFATDPAEEDCETC